MIQGGRVQAGRQMKTEVTLFMFLSTPSVKIDMSSCFVRTEEEKPAK